MTDPIAIFMCVVIVVVFGLWVKQQSDDNDPKGQHPLLP